MWNVLYNLEFGTEIDHHGTEVFMHDVPEHSTAKRIASNLQEEGFVGAAWVVEA